MESVAQTIHASRPDVKIPVTLLRGSAITTTRPVETSRHDVLYHPKSAEVAFQRVSSLG